MIRRLIKHSKNNSLLVFGARGTGKSTLVKEQLLKDLEGEHLYYDLLLPKEEDRFLRDPSLLEREIENQKPTWAVIDEIQKAPKLLNIIHSLIERQMCKFIMTGSSARKLRLSSANLLAGRAFSIRLFPFTSVELGDRFDLEKSLQYGTLPKTIELNDQFEIEEYLRSYVFNYIREEIQIEQLVRKLDPFREFLEIAAQMNGKIINSHKISREVLVSDKTILSYFKIIEETYLGFFLPAFHTSIRKSQLRSPKFYFFDTGVKKTLERSLHSHLTKGTGAYGEAFEHFVICEFYRLNEYTRSDYRMSYFQTSAGGEIDLVLSRPGSPVILIEIKSTDHIDNTEIRKISEYKKEINNSEAYYLSQDKHSYKIDGVTCLHWQQGLSIFFSLLD